MKPPSHSLYAKLTEDQRAQLHDWILTLGYSKTLERLPLPEPEGFGMTTHLSCLHRFFSRYSTDLDLEHASETENTNRPVPSRLFPLAEQAAHAGAFRLSAAPLDPNTFGQLSDWVNTQQANNLKRDYVHIAEHNAAIADRRAALAEKRLELDRDKFRFNAAKAALEHYPEISKIVPSTTDYEKILAVAGQLFQPAPAPLSNPDSSSDLISNREEIVNSGETKSRQAWEA